MSRFPGSGERLCCIGVYDMMKMATKKSGAFASDCVKCGLTKRGWYGMIVIHTVILCPSGLSAL